MKTIGIIGGGVIGLSCAYYLQQEGYEVTIIDAREMTWGCSWLNAGMIVPSHIVPLSAPGMVAKGIRWMLSNESPFAIYVKKDKEMVRWLRLFYQHANKKHVQQAIPYLRDINRLSKSLYRSLAADKGFDFGYQEKGLFLLYQTAGAEKKEIETAHLANEAGVEARILSKEEVRKLEPDAPPEVKGGVYFPGDASLSPDKFMQNMIQQLSDKNIEIITNKKITGFECKGEKITKAVCGNSTYTFDEFILAGGAQSGMLLKSIGINLPLQGGKGYSFTLEGLTKNIRIPSLLIEGRVAITPLSPNKLRVGGTMVIGDDSLKISSKRVSGILNTLHQFYPAFKDAVVSPEQVTSGQRPCSPDGLPYIGRLQKFSNLIIATGHGMMGMSLGPATGKLVNAIVSGKRLDMDIDAFNPQRFV